MAKAARGKAGKKRDASIPKPKLKVVVRRLWKGITEATMRQRLADIGFADKLTDMYFVKADPEYGTSAFGRCYISMVTKEDAVAVARRLQSEQFMDSDGRPVPACVEYAPFQKPTIKKQTDPSKIKVDSRVGTIENDAHYKAFCEALEKVVEQLPSADKQLEAREAENKDKKVPPTALVEYIIQKRKNEVLARRSKRRGAKEPTIMRHVPASIPLQKASTSYATAVTGKEPGSEMHADRMEKGGGSAKGSNWSVLMPGRNKERITKKEKQQQGNKSSGVVGVTGHTTTGDDDDDSWSVVKPKTATAEKSTAKPKTRSRAQQLRRDRQRGSSDSADSRQPKVQILPSKAAAAAAAAKAGSQSSSAEGDHRGADRSGHRGPVITPPSQARSDESKGKSDRGQDKDKGEKGKGRGRPSGSNATAAQGGDRVSSKKSSSGGGGRQRSGQPGQGAGRAGDGGDGGGAVVKKKTAGGGGSRPGSGASSSGSKRGGAARRADGGDAKK